MAVFNRTIKTAISLFFKGEWREFYIRALIVLRIIDIGNIADDQIEPASERAHSYSDSGREDLQKVLSTLNIRETDSIIDFGCGKGGALIVMSDYPFFKVTGVEISLKLAEIAKRNVKRLKLRKVEIIPCDATEFDCLDDYNYFYFYNPFPCLVMEHVIESIKTSLAIKPRNVRVIYLNPICHEVVISGGAFEKISELNHFNHKFYIYHSAN